MANIVWTVTTFYTFVPLQAESLPGLRGELKSWMSDREMVGLVVLAEEGINGTVGGSSEAVFEFKAHIRSLFGEDVSFKDSECDFAPFKRMVVDIRKEVVGMKRPDLVPASPNNRHLSPREWHQMLESEDPKIIVDTRNRYETVAGMFDGAVDPEIDNFSEWGAYLDQAQLPRDVPIMIYCTGGIRCEKAILELDARGYENVVQLRDGILGYLAEYPGGHFEGECFVFDERVTVGQDLRPTGNYGICPASGMTSSLSRECSICGKSYFIDPGHEVDWGEFCSKRCRNSVLVQQHTRSGGGGPQSHRAKNAKSAKEH